MADQEAPATHHEVGPSHTLERVVFFSDAVFAIAITLLVIELHVPHVDRNAPDLAYLAVLAGMIPDFVAYFISFFVIGAFWTGHHRAFACAEHWSPRLMLPNLMMLCAIAAMPFFTSFLSLAVLRRVPVMLYCGWLVLTALLNIRLQRMVTSPPIVSEHVPPATIRMIRQRGLGVLLGALTALAIGFVFPPAGSFALMTIGLWRRLITWLDERNRWKPALGADVLSARRTPMADQPGTSPHNISTDHQKHGDARRPADTLDRENTHDAVEFDPAEDVGRAEPGKDNEEADPS